ncbi:MAG: nucleoporin autopeptidase-domain-containing protein [Olpidium bornovanus]|uniref:Nucleoporin autopeptidase-domain-containing protein n=1 Tax=Olpidium bornovanus TaxID=278681 RepID=A0A8H7ZQD0_9FUNG|nr:MAG: nucleoporin autopeptidase-domain-containing protein [Olpidium bornovanus]
MSGTAQSSTATAFNAKPATSGFSFGGSLGTEAKPPAFGFGQTTAQPAPTASTGLFGSTSTTTTPLFSGTTQPSTGLFAPTTSSTSAFGTGLFAPKPAGTASTPAPFTLGQTSSTGGTGFGGFTGLGGPSTLGVSTAQSTGPPLQASLNENAYGSSPLFTSPQKDKPASGLATSVGPLAVPTRPAAATPLASSVYRPARSTYKKPSPMSAARTKQLRFASSFGGSPSPSPSAKPSTHLFDGKPDGELLSTSMLVPRRSIKKLVITPRNGSAAAAGEREGHENGIDPSLEAEAEEGNLSVSSSVYGRTPNKADRLTPGPTPGSAQSHASEVSPPKSFERGKYWTSPTISSLQKKPAGQLKSVKDFQVGRYGFGQIRFVDPVDLTEVTEGLDAIPGRIVQIFDRHCMVYADDENKPALGHGLNVPAVVSLENCYFIDKATREPIRDFNDRRYIRHLNRLKREQDTEFIDFLSETGTWVFRVEHFSRYGLFDDDDEDDEEGEEGDQDLRRSLREGTFAPERPAAQQAASIPRRPFELLPDALNPEDTFMGLRKARAVEPANVKPAYSAATRQESVMDTEDKRGGLLERVEGDANMLMTDEGASGDEDLASFPGGSQMAAAANSDDEVTSYSDGNVDSQEDFRVASREGAIPVRELPESTRPFGTLRPLAHSIGLDPREVQVRQASLFARLSPGRGKVLEKEMFGTAVIEHIEMLDDFNRVSHEQFPQGYKRPKSPTDSEASDDMDVDARVPNTFFQAPPARRIRKQPRIQYSRSVLYGKSCEVADAGLMMNRLFRVGWGPGGQIPLILSNYKISNEGEDEEEPNNEEGSAYACITMEKVSVFKSFQVGGGPEATTRDFSENPDGEFPECQNSWEYAVLSVDGHGEEGAWRGVH